MVSFVPVACVVALVALVAVAAFPPMLKPAAVPVMFVPTSVDGVPRLGVTKVGLFESTTLTVPVEEVTPVPPLATGSVPVTPEVRGRPVALVRTPDAGVPNTGDVKEGDVRCVFCWAKLVPSDQTVIVLPAGIATPAPAAVVLPRTVEL